MSADYRELSRPVTAVICIKQNLIIQKYGFPVLIKILVGWKITLICSPQLRIFFSLRVLSSHKKNAFLFEENKQAYTKISIYSAIHVDFVCIVMKLNKIVGYNYHEWLVT